MKIILIAITTFLFFCQPNTTAIEQVKALKRPVMVVSRFGAPKFNANVYMAVQDGDGNYVDLHKDSTLMYLVNKYKSGDTIK